MRYCDRLEIRLLGVIRKMLRTRSVTSGTLAAEADALVAMASVVGGERDAYWTTRTASARLRVVPDGPPPSR